MKTKDPTSIEFCAGMEWHEVETWLASNVHMLALGKDDVGLEVARTFEKHGPEPATAEIVAHLALRVNGLNRFTDMATSMYADIARELEEKVVTEKGKKRVEELKWAIHQMQGWTAYAGCYGFKPKEFEWPVKMPVEKWSQFDKRAGLANIMLYLAGVQLERQSTCGLVAANSIMSFITEGMNRIEKRKREGRGIQPRD